jgi:hypothetical protein
MRARYSNGRRDHGSAGRRLFYHGEAVSSEPLINAGVKLLGSPGYLTIVEDFKNTLVMQATYTPDIWVS